MCGIGPKHVRRLCDNVFEGGMGYTPQQVGDMTLDEIFMLLTDRRLLRGVQKMRTIHDSSVRIEADGRASGRDRDGNPIRARIGGKSKARQLMEEQAALKKMTGRQRRAYHREQRRLGREKENGS